jgi:hypothetical protein
VAVFITGSDPDTRTRWLFEAATLARRGVASLLYDKRGVGESLGASHDLASWDDLAGDVEGAIDYLLTRSDAVDTARIGLIGQSQGTWMIAKVAARNAHVAFAVNISGGAMSAAAQETYRTGALMRRAGFADTAICAGSGISAAEVRGGTHGHRVGGARLDDAAAAARLGAVGPRFRNGRGRAHIRHAPPVRRAPVQLRPAA